MITYLAKKGAAWKHYVQKSIYYLRQASLRKILNVSVVEFERKSRRSYMRGKPYYFFIDPCDACNLRCPLCLTGAGSRKSVGMLKLEDFQTILDKVAPFAVEIALHSWGEPLLNKQIFSMIEEIRKRRIYPVMSTNLNVHIDHLGDQLIDAGLEKLIVSLDGVSQEVYEQYRVRGDIELVFANLRSLIEAKRRRGAKRPLIEWQYIVFQHNEHELALARSLASDLGVDNFRIELPYFPPGTYNLEADAKQLASEKKWFPSNKAFSQMNPANLRTDGFLYDEPCFNLYRGLFITPKGAVSPCCFATEGHHQFGNLLYDDLDTIWNNEQYRGSRSLFGHKPTEYAGTLCDGCFLFKRQLGTQLAQRKAEGLPITFYEDLPT